MLKKIIYDQLSKIMIVFIIMLIVLIFSKTNNSFRERVKFHLYEDNISFMSIKSIYDKYLGGVDFFNNNKDNSYMVFNSKLSYQNIEKYDEGMKLQVMDNYLVPSLDSGIVIFIGQKENFGNTIIIQTSNNINIWYGNINNTSLKLYDYVDKGEYLGESNNDYIYIAYSKGNKMLNFSKYFKN